ncbi:MAG: PIN domain-containing protein [bacterium]|nr:PIN domain-containing protein [bacterium]
MAKPKIFFDSSVLLAALLSPRGGSFYILNELGTAFEFYINEYVLEEVLRVLDQKFQMRPNLKNELLLLLGLTDVKILPQPSPENIDRVSEYINKKDAPILAGALGTSDYLLSLDNDFFSSELMHFARTRGLTIVKPQMFLEEIRNV